MTDTPEADRLALISGFIDRYLADEIDRAELNDLVSIARLQLDWPHKWASGRLIVLTAHHLFMFERGDWSEETLRTSLAQLQEWATVNDRQFGTIMFDQQWLALMDAGHVPPGMRFTHSRVPTTEQVEELLRQRRRDRRG